MHNFDYKHHIKALGDILHLPTEGEGNVPKSFRYTQFWVQTIGEGPYMAKSSKTSRIQNPIFQYIHKVLAHTIFSQRNSTRSTTFKELYFLHAIVNNYSVNGDVFLAKQFSRISNSKTVKIVIWGLITPITEHIGLIFNSYIDPHLLGRSRYDIKSLMQMRMIYPERNTYGLIVHEKI